MSEQAGKITIQESNLAKAMDLLAREIDKRANRHHKDALSTFETDVDTILKDGKRNL